MLFSKRVILLPPLSSSRLFISKHATSLHISVSGNSESFMKRYYELRALMIYLMPNVAVRFSFRFDIDRTPNIRRCNLGIGVKSVIKMLFCIERNQFVKLLRSNTLYSRYTYVEWIKTEVQNFIVMHRV